MLSEILTHSEGLHRIFLSELQCNTTTVTRKFTLHFKFIGDTSSEAPKVSIEQNNALFKE